MPIFILVILGLFVVGDLAWMAFAWGKLKGKPAGRWVLAMFMALMGLGLVFALTRRGAGWPGDEPVVLRMAVFIWHLFVLPLGFVLLFVGSAIGGLARVGRWWSKKKDVVATPEPVAMEPVGVETVPIEPAGGVSRRQLLGMTMAVAPPVVLGMSTGYSVYKRREFDIRQVEVPIAGLPLELDGLSIAHLSDTHLGEFSDGLFYDAAIEEVLKLKADLIVHTGDVINHDVRDLPAAMGGLAKLKAPLGVFVCEGNHDLIANPQLFRREISRLENLKFLRSAGAMIFPRGHAVQILGVRWGTPVPKTPGDRGKEESIGRACDDLQPAVDPGAVLRVALAHHPHAFDYMPFAHLTLAGHTHGGQLNLTKNIGCGSVMYRYWSGLYQREGRSLFVSNGTGNWFPLRINAPAELVKLTLRRA